MDHYESYESQRLGSHGYSFKGMGKKKAQNQAYSPRNSDSPEEHQCNKGKHPPGLKGREIGLWYARRNKTQQEKHSSNNTSSLFLDPRREANIRHLLGDLQRKDLSPGQSTSSQMRSDNDMKGNYPDYWEIGCNEMETKNAEDEAVEIKSKELPGSWEMTELVDSKNYASGALSSSLEELVDLDQDDNEVVPSIVGVVDYIKSHDEYALVGQESQPDFPDYITREISDSNSDFNKSLKLSLENLVQKDQYISMLEFRKKLPSFEMKDVIVEMIRDNQVLVISGETGCGKTTQVPQFILDEYIKGEQGSQCRIICTQPRRISAISVAEHVAAERCEKVDVTETSSVGYQIRLESRLPRSQGSILFCTTGIVLKFLEKDPSLNRATHVIIDEIHERDLQSDFLMIILKDLIQQRPDLRVILMSATLNADMFSKYFNNCPILHIPGHTFPVQEYLLEDIIEMLNYIPDDTKKARCRQRKHQMTSTDKEDQENYAVWCRNLSLKYKRKTVEILQNFDFFKIDLNLIVQIISHICHSMQDGAILIFVPGWEEIKKLHVLIQKTLRLQSGSFRIIPLHSLMPTINQKDVFERPPPGVRKIVIATNIAETSITIDDVVYVIDCGKIKVKNFLPEANLASLDTQWVSKANAKQRRGRAGRVQPGHCFHLYTEFHYITALDYLPPEMLRTRLEELCLQIKLLKLGKIVPFISKAMQHPPVESITHAVETLIALNALDMDENLLPLGYHLARLPVEPHMGKMLLFGAMFCCLDPILTVAASLSFKDAFTIPLGKEYLADEVRKRLAGESRSDHIMLINALKGWEDSKNAGKSRSFCWEHFLSENTLQMLFDMKKQLCQLLFDIGFVSSQNVKYSQSNINSKNLGLIKAVLCAGFYPNVAEIIKVPSAKTAQKKTVTMLIKDNSKVLAHPKSVNARQTYFNSSWVVYYYKLKTKQVYVHDSTMISPYPLLFFGGDIKIVKNNDQEMLCVDGWIKFKAPASTARLVKDLRVELDKLLSSKITSPGPTVWEQSEREGALMTAIVDLIAGEEKGYAKFGSKLGGSVGFKSPRGRAVKLF